MTTPTSAQTPSPIDHSTHPRPKPAATAATPSENSLSLAVSTDVEHSAMPMKATLHIMRITDFASPSSPALWPGSWGRGECYLPLSAHRTSPTSAQTPSPIDHSTHPSPKPPAAATAPSARSLPPAASTDVEHSAMPIQATLHTTRLTTCAS